MSEPMQTKQTALHAQHLSGEASMGEEAGWSMPLRFGAVAEEVQACRERAGVFDVSNVGRLRVRGDGALELLERVCTHDVARQEDNTASPTLLLNERGGILDMGILYRLDRFWVLTTSPDNREKILAHLQAQEIAGVKIDDQTNKVAQLAAVGPGAQEILQNVLPIQVGGLSRGEVRVGSIFVANYIASRTGLAGQWSMEVMIPNLLAGRAWTFITKKAGDRAMKPAGLLAREILRQQAHLPRFGCELNETIDPATAGLMHLVALDHDFIGAEAAAKWVDTTPARRRVALTWQAEAAVEAPTILPTMGTPVVDGEGNELGAITSAAADPTSGTIYAQAYLAAHVATSGATVFVQQGDSGASPAATVETIGAEG